MAFLNLHGGSDLPRRAVEGAGVFLRWWGGELLGLVPAALRARLGLERAVLLLDLDDGTPRAVLLGAAGREDLGPVARAGGVPLSPDDLTPAVRERLKRRPRLAVRSPDALARDLVLPLAAAADLDAVLRFDMDRQTPFAAHEVRFAHRVLARDTEARRLTVRLTVAPREACAAAERLADALGLRLRYFGPADAAPWHDNLAAGDAPAFRRLRRGLIGLAFVLAAVALWLPLHRDGRTAAAHGAAVAEVRAAASALADRRAAMDGVESAAALVVERRATVLAVLRDLTAALPDDAYLDRMAWRDGRVEIAGSAASTARVVARLAAVPTFADVEYQSSVVSVGAGGREQFNLTLTVRDGGPP